MEGTTERTGRIPIFDGSIDKFQVYWMKAKAYALVHKFSKAMAKEPEADLPDAQDDIIDETTNSGKKAAAALR